MNKKLSLKVINFIVYNILLIKNNYKGINKLQIKGISLKNFRNYNNEVIMFSNGLNVISGSNASGKTNLVEAIYYTGLGKSPRTSKDKELIKWEKESAYIKIKLEKKYRTHIIEIMIDSQGKKRILIDKIPVRKISELIGVLNVVYFSPDEMDIIKESPIERRKFLDISLSQQKKIYFSNLVRYNKIIGQRNKLIKNNRDIKMIKENLPIWDSQLARVGAAIIKDRYEYVEKLSIITKEEHKMLTNNKENLIINYESKIENCDIKQMEKQFDELLKKSYDKDINLGYTTVGSHRDDMSIKINDIDVRKFGSQGQKRTTALSLKLAEVKMFTNLGEKPILILDDVLSELDESRQNALLKVVSEVQTFLTCTHYNGENNNKIIIENGEVKK